MSTLPPSETALPAPPSARVRLDYLDGLRGLAALYVALSHIPGGALPNLPHPLQSLFSWMPLGRVAVAIFIVLSGYCLMLPVVRSASGQLPGGTLSYLKRRARRILPPYYAALGLTLVFNLVSSTGLSYFHGQHQPIIAKLLDPANVVLHLLLLHNLSSLYTLGIDFPTWSVAMEWQIYFLFPLLLLPVWRRFGLLAALAAGFLLGLAPHFLLPKEINLDWTAFWFIGLFALGMAAAVVNFSNNPRIQEVSKRTPWLVISIVPAVTVAVMLAHRADLLNVPWTWQMDTLLGIAAASLIIYCTNCLTKREASNSPLILRLLQSKPLVALGAFSYSLYLTHMIFPLKVYPLLERLHASPIEYFVLLCVVVMPYTVICAYLFHLVFERPFMPGHPRTERRAEQAAIVSPAP